jgi:hypothetical protein
MGRKLVTELPKAAKFVAKKADEALDALVPRARQALQDLGLPDDMIRSFLSAKKDYPEGIPRQDIDDALGVRHRLMAEPRVTPGPDASDAEWSDWGAQHGVNMARTPDVSIGITDLTSGREITIPGGLEGEFTIPDLFAIKARNFDPNALPKATHDELMKKFIRTYAKDGASDDVDIFNALNFSLLSPNAPLTPNEFMAMRARARTPEDLAALSERVGEAGLGGKIAEEEGIRAAKAGGMGILGTANPENMAEMARLIEKNPDMFRAYPGEDVRDITFRVMNQVPGLSTKTTSLGTPFLDLQKGNTSAVDLHMIRNAYPRMLREKNKVGKQFKERMAKLLNVDPSKVVNYTNKNPKEAEKAAISIIGGSSKDTVYRTASGELKGGLDPRVSPEKLSYEPKKVADFNPFYKRVMEYVDESRGPDPELPLFMEQWRLWDTYRGRVEPHEFAHPDWRKLPKQSWQEMQESLQAHKAAGYTGQSPVMKESNWRKLYYGAGAPVAAGLAAAGTTQETQAGPVSGAIKYGKTLKGIHYSKAEDPLRRLSGARHGEGARGEEAARLMGLTPEQRQRTYFYPEGSRGREGYATPQPEMGVGGGATYQVKTPHMYDIKENPLKLGTQGTELEEDLRGLGYRGMYHPDHGIAYNFDAETEAVMLGRTRAEAEQALARTERLPDQPYNVTAEALPSIDTPFGGWLSKQPLDMKERYTQGVENIHEQIKVMDELGIKDYKIVPGYGSFQGRISPNTIISTPDEGSAKAVADLRGGVSKQDAVPFFQRTLMETGGEGPFGVRVQLNEGISPDKLQQIYKDLNVDFTRSDLDTLDFINFVDDGGQPFSQLDDAQFGAKLEQYFGNLGATEDVQKYTARSQYNDTTSFWLPGADAGSDAGTGPLFRELRDRIKSYNTTFAKQHRGSADPRALALLGTLTAGGGVLATQEAFAWQASADQIVSESLSETYRAATKFAQLKRQKAPQWQRIRMDLVDTMSSAINYLTKDAGPSNTDMSLEALDKPMRAFGAGLSTIGNVATGQFGQIAPDAQQIMRQDSTQTAGPWAQEAHDAIAAQAGNSAMMHGAADLAKFGINAVPYVAPVF